MENGPRKARLLDLKISVETPEQIRFTYDLAGPGSRMLAYGMDLSIRLAGMSLVGGVILLLTGWATPGLGLGLLLLIAFAMEWGYHTLFEWLWNGQTPGKRVLGLRVIRRSGVPLDLVRSAMRNLLRAADIFPMAYAAGLITMFATGSPRRLGDIAADTIVVRTRKAALRDLPALPQDAVELTWEDMASLKLRPKELALVDAFFRRAPILSPERAAELAEILAQPLAQRLQMENTRPDALLAGLLLAEHARRSYLFGSRLDETPSETLRPAPSDLGDSSP
jgi:uncharacterized RDD family membrane protein YckC